MTQELDRQIEAARREVISIDASPKTNQPQNTWWSVTNAMTISVAVLFYGAFTLILAALLIKSGKSSESVLRIFGTILIIIVAVFLVVAGYSNDQIAPVIGLLGTLAGYLLGKGESSSMNRKD
jgi:succinate-acetate transporter protein